MSHLARAFSSLAAFLTLVIFILDRCWFEGKRNRHVLKVCVCVRLCNINAATYYPPNTSGWTTQWFWPLFLYHLSSPVALSSVCHPFIHYLSIILWPFPMLLISLPLLFVFCLIDHSSPPSISHFPFDIFFSVFTLSPALSLSVFLLSTFLSPTYSVL